MLISVAARKAEGAWLSGSAKRVRSPRRGARRSPADSVSRGRGAFLRTHLRSDLFLVGKGRAAHNCVQEGHEQRDGGFGYEMVPGWHVGNADLGTCFHISTDGPFQVPSEI